MKIDAFKLERWFAKYEHKAEIMLAESGIRSLNAKQFDLNPGKLGYIIPTNGDPHLRKQIGQRYNRGAEEVLFTCGTQEANFLVFLSLLSKRNHAVVVTPTYQALHTVPEAIGNVTRVWLQPPSWKLNIEEVSDAIREDTTLIVLNNPNNPTGKYHSAEKVDALYDLAEDNDAYLLCDEVYRLIADDPLDPVASMGPHGISTTSLTKAYGLAGTRFGWIAGPRDVINGAWRWKDYTTISPSILGQHIAKQVLGEMEGEILKENRDLAKKNRKIVHQFINNHDLAWNSPTGVIGFITIPKGFGGSKAFCRHFFNEEKVVLAPGEVFGFDQYFRLGFGLPTPELREGLVRLSNFLKD